MPNEMWMVEAIIQPFKLETVTLALARIPGFGGMTVSDCRGFGRGKLAADAAASEQEPIERHRRNTAEVELADFTAKVRIEIAVATRATADAVADTIAQSAHTGRRGDGKIFTWAIERAIRVRTFQADGAAL